MYESADADLKIIQERTEHRKKTLLQIGWLEAEPDYYKAQQNKIYIFNGSNRTSDNEEDDLMKNIRTRKDGRHEFRKMINGQIFQCISRDKNKVKEYAAKLKREIKEALKKPNSNIKFCDYAREFYELFIVSKIKDKAKEEWEIALRYFDKELNKPFKSYLPTDFQRDINKIAEKSPSTAKKTYNKICAICKKAFWSGIIKLNIAEIIEKPEYEEKARRALTLMEQVKFLNLMKREDKDFQNFCLFCIVTSARREEAYRYKPQDFNRSKMTLFVNGTKTLNAPRTIRITKEFAEVLNQIGKGFKHTSDYYSRKAKDLFTKIGSPDLVLNCLRHTCATNMVYLGIPSDFRKHIMGHSTVLTTDRVYTHIEVGVTKARMQLIYKNLYFSDYLA